MSATVAQIQFTELVSEYDDLMCIETVPSDLVELRLTPDREQRVLELTARYIRELDSIQQSHDSAAAEFAGRVRAQDATDTTCLDTEFLEPICQRFLAGAGMTLRGEIPRSIPRSKKRQSRRLIINWTHEPPLATWDEIGVEFPLRDSLLFCAEHSAGADTDLSARLADQLISDLRKGRTIIRRLSLESSDDQQSVYHWDTALAPSSEGAGAAPVETADPAEEESPIVSYLEDCAQSFDCGTHELSLEQSSICENVDEQVAGIIALNGGPCDIIQKRVEQFASRAMQCGASNEKLLTAMSSAAYSGIAAAMRIGDEPVIDQRVKVFRSVNQLKTQMLPDTFSASSSESATC